MGKWKVYLQQIIFLIRYKPRIVDGKEQVIQNPQFDSEIAEAICLKHSHDPKVQGFQIAQAKQARKINEGYATPKILGACQTRYEQIYKKYCQYKTFNRDGINDVILNNLEINAFNDQTYIDYTTIVEHPIIKRLDQYEINDNTYEIDGQYFSRKKIMRLVYLMTINGQQIDNDMLLSIISHNSIMTEYDYQRLNTAIINLKVERTIQWKIS